MRKRESVFCLLKDAPLSACWVVPPPKMHEEHFLVEQFFFHWPALKLDFTRVWLKTQPTPSPSPRWPRRPQNSAARTPAGDPPPNDRAGLTPRKKRKTSHKTQHRKRKGMMGRELKHTSKHEKIKRFLEGEGVHFLEQYWVLRQLPQTAILPLLVTFSDKSVLRTTLQPSLLQLRLDMVSFTIFWAICLVTSSVPAAANFFALRRSRLD